MRRLLDVRAEVAGALEAGAPVVALESTVFVHGLPPPHNLEAAARMESAAREEGAVPAAVGVLAGRLVVGLRPDEIEVMVAAGVAKVSTADLAAVLAAGRPGATTVASTAAAAARAGIRVLATGGIGGVHRGGAGALDVSADLTELARSPICVVCSGAKAVLDLARTLEALETLGVPVIGYATDEFPAFYARESGLALSHRVESPEEAAEVMASQWEASLPAGVVLAHPPPAAQAVPSTELQPWIDEALAAAASGGVRGKEVTPFLLAHLARASRGRTLAANLALLEANARLAARVAVAYGRLMAA